MGTSWLAHRSPLSNLFNPALLAPLSALHHPLFMYVSFLSMYIPTPLSTAFRLPHRLQDQSRSFFSTLEPPPRQTSNCAETSRVGVPTRFRGALQPQQLPKEDETTRRGAINTMSKQKSKKKSCVPVSTASFSPRNEAETRRGTQRSLNETFEPVDSLDNPPTHPKRNPEILHSQPALRLYTFPRNQPYRGY